MYKAMVYSVDMIMDRVRQAIGQSGKSRYRIWQETKVDQATLCKIMAGGTCSMETADKLCDYLHLELRPRPRKGR
jgi:hypothetical protein